MTGTAPKQFNRIDQFIENRKARQFADQSMIDSRSARGVGAEQPVLLARIFHRLADQRLARGQGRFHP
jgi:hypothetical protein